MLHRDDAKYILSAWLKSKTIAFPYLLFLFVDNIRQNEKVNIFFLSLFPSFSIPHCLFRFLLFYIQRFFIRIIEQV